VAEHSTSLSTDGSRPAGSRSASSEVQHTSLSDQVYNVLWRQIVNRTLRPGDKISDLQISEELGVSRTPVREALYRLAQDKIVEVKSQRGFFVASFFSQDVQEIYDVRAALEVLAMRLALPHLTATQLDAAQQALDEARRQVEHDAEGGRAFWLQVDRDFHQMLGRAAGNQRLESFIAGLQGQIGVLQVYGTYLLEIEQMALGHHQMMLDAMRSGDGAAAARAMERHIHEVKARMLAEFEARAQRAVHTADPRRDRKPRP
jgi:DNA-binding GntR family transcriptional regulator